MREFTHLITFVRPKNDNFNSQIVKKTRSILYPPYLPPDLSCPHTYSSSRTFPRESDRGRTCTCLPSCTGPAWRTDTGHSLGPHRPTLSAGAGPVAAESPSPPSRASHPPSFAVVSRWNCSSFVVQDLPCVVLCWRFEPLPAELPW